MVGFFIYNIHRNRLHCKTTTTSKQKRLWLRLLVGIYLPLLGCLETFDLLVEELMAAGTEEAKRTALRRAEDEWDKVEGQKMQKRAEIYVKVQ